MHSDIKIKNCLKQLLKNKSFDRITVTEICDLSKVSRRTFYNHFDDMYDLLYEILKDASNELAEKERSAGYDAAKESTWEKALGIGLRYFRDNKDIIMSIYNSDSWDIVKERVSDRVKKSISEAVDRASVRTGVKLTAVDADFLSGFYSSLFIVVVEKYLRHGMPDDPAWIVNYISTILDPSFDNAVKALAGRAK
ncbi:MAG: TetR/AcrR family transcriptional regulator C-terminal domain-containing protein [Eubacterium sp.]|nr:TetR/AcrR family transcriptional regulator C-terminal domain-containing protein [Eubacterium sp.]